MATFYITCSVAEGFGALVWLAVDLAQPLVGGGVSTERCRCARRGHIASKAE